MQKTIMFIGAGQHQLPGIQYAKTRGHRIIALDGDANAPGFSCADESHVVNIKDVDACFGIAQKCTFDGVLALATEAGVRSASFIAEKFGLSGLPFLAACNATDKLAMRKNFSDAGIPSTLFRSCRSIDEANEAYRKLGPRVVVKPANSAGSRGVSFVQALEDVSDAFSVANVVADGGDILVEAFLEGPEVAVDGFMIGDHFHLFCVSDKIRTTPPALLDTSVIFPAERSASECDAIVEVATRAAQVLGIRNAPIHAELIVTREGPKMVEIAARGAGFHVFTEIMPWVSGVDTVKAQIALCLGDHPDVQAGPLKAAVLEFPLAPAGRVQAIEGMESLASDPGLIFSEVFCKVGDLIGPLRSGADRVAALCAKGETLIEARSALLRARSKLNISIESRVKQ
ncbi:ATP-grasp domain-containing protein [Bradyrhizobium sp. G127]|uniref:ATP-grasp domain-containing protein n=1 Tax=Bradyrhizobium sp. G127 TaxID=2904800 RepID=UPI001F165B55|nr:ATP-grasp domain-containing protein [Bradyrhizobium sp. G127]